MKTIKNLQDWIEDKGAELSYRIKGRKSIVTLTGKIVFASDPYTKDRIVEITGNGSDFQSALTDAISKWEIREKGNSKYKSATHGISETKIKRLYRRRLLYKGALYVRADSGFGTGGKPLTPDWVHKDPDGYKKEHGRCPRGYHDKEGKCKSLHDLAQSGDHDIIEHKDVSSVHDVHGATPLHHLAKGKGDPKKIMSHKDVAKSKDIWGDTPLHHLAKRGRIEVLEHPEVSKVRNDTGDTPLHELARAGKADALKHVDANRVKNRNGHTPSDLYKNRHDPLYD